MKNVKDMRIELMLKEQRVAYWERFHTVPTMTELMSTVDVIGGVIA